MSAPAPAQRVDLRERAVDVGRLGDRHRLHRDRRVAADRDRCRQDLTEDDRRGYGSLELPVDEHQPQSGSDDDVEVQSTTRAPDQQQHHRVGERHELRHVDLVAPALARPDAARRWRWRSARRRAAAAGQVEEPDEDVDARAGTGAARATPDSAACDATAGLRRPATSGRSPCDCSPPLLEPDGVGTRRGPAEHRVDVVRQARRREERAEDADRLPTSAPELGDRVRAAAGDRLAARRGACGPTPRKPTALSPSGLWSSSVAVAVERLPTALVLDH